MKSINLNSLYKSGNPFLFRAILALFFCCLFTVKGYMQWQVVGNNALSGSTAWFPNIEEFNAQPVVAYNDFDEYINTKILSGSAWTNDGIADLSLYGVFVHDFETTNLNKYLAVVDFNGDISVKQNLAASWNNIGVPIVGSTSLGWVDLVVDSLTPYIAYWDNTIATPGVSVKRFNGLVWEYVGAPGFITDMYYAPKVEMNNGEIHILYVDSSTVTHILMFDGVNWVNAYPPITSPNLFLGDNIIFNQGIPYVTLYEHCPDSAAFTITVKKFEAGSWQNVGIPNFRRIYSYGYKCIDFDNANSPYISFLTNSGLVVYKFDGSNWTILGNGYEFYNEPIGSYDMEIINDSPYLVRWITGASEDSCVVHRYSSPTGISNDENTKTISISPNPATSCFRIGGIEELGEINRIEIINSIGQIIRIVGSEEIANNNIKCDDLLAGNYFVRIYSDKVYSKRLIIQ